eukprot:TRINITY_DN2960_c0_g1_i7.p1 TRINITY_DN2960_c0_g1~~TRINITY_DN2960_c0_g1_i7.p1  ORF type:complete len:107 (-),score=46.41 TRINITY_DN2960_c0_g1_i7:45-365(-)
MCIRDSHGAAFRAHHDLVLGFLELGHTDHALALAGGEQGGFVHEVREIGAGEARRTARNNLGIHVRAQRHLAHMHFQDCLLYTSDAADDLLCVDLGGRRILQKKKK